VRLTRAKAEPAAPWLVRYRRLNAGLVEEEIRTKQQARDRFFTVKALGDVEFVELRNPAGQLWFRDKFFGERA
jgi:hypothetical protein